MNFEIKMLLISFCVTIVLSVIIIPLLKKLKIGQMERNDGPQSHLKKQGTPTMGGIMMIISLLICVIGVYLYYLKNNQLDIANNIIPMLILSIGFGMVGFIDDFKKLNKKNTEGLKPKYKMLGLLAISVIYVLLIVKGANIGTQTYIPFFKTYIDIPIYLYIPFAVLVILGTTNAVNLTDGIDGLASSVCAIIVTCLTVIGIMFNIQEVVIFGSIVIGAILGFLIFNLHPAKVFMGDTGSLFLGGVISVLALYLKVPLLLLLIALIPVFETLSVIIQVAYFKKTGNRIFKMAPLHHHFELSGWKESKIVIVFSLITLVLCLVGLKAI